ncbi:hypothetical protein [Sinimarinibacterium flocculans]|uniref:hypothetical protein n=1 Tax=Sinimarinibacterium flocculans TaxID=985250 RepID=UPI0035156E09
MRIPVVRTTLLAATLALVACQGGFPMSASAPQPVAGKVTDVSAFEAFIATRPTPEAFRQTYPDVTLVLPGQIATKELRFDNSRYFAQLDEQGRIVGGKFQ